MNRCLIAGLILLLNTSAIAGAVFVPWDFDTIQEAVDNVSNGDSVLVGEGVFTGEGNRNISMEGRSLYIGSTSGRDYTTLDIEAGGYGFIFVCGEDSTSIIEGFTVKNAYNPGYGGGLYISGGSSPVIRGCRISENTAGYGGGLYCAYDSMPLLDRCIFMKNNADVGGAIWCYFASPRLENCTFTDNDAFQGGAVGCQTCDPVILHCTFTGNTALSGGALKLYTASPEITNTIMWGDEPQEIFGYDSNPTVSYSDIQGGWPGFFNIDADPCFLSDTDLHLAGTSPCIDTGAEIGVFIDVDGETRPSGWGFDIGIDEYISGGLALLTENFPDTVQAGSDLAFLAVVENTGSEEASFDEAVLFAEGPLSETIVIYDGAPVRIAPRASISGSISLHVPAVAPTGDYIITLTIFNLNEEIDSTVRNLFISEAP